MTARRLFVLAAGVTFAVLGLVATFLLGFTRGYLVGYSDAPVLEAPIATKETPPANIIRQPARTRQGPGPGDTARPPAIRR